MQREHLLKIIYKSLHLFAPSCTFLPFLMCYNDIVRTCERSSVGLEPRSRPCEDGAAPFLCRCAKGGIAVGRTMTEKQRRFAEEYLIDCNATRAYMAAYPGCKKYASADACARKLLENTRVRAYIDEKLAEISSAKTADAKEVLEYLTSVLRGESSAEVVVVEGCGDGVSEARCLIKAPDEKERLKAAELLGKRFGLFSEKVSLEGPAKVVIVDDLDE